MEQLSVIFKGHFDTISGYGNSAVQICVGLAKHGCNVYPIAYDMDFELPREFTDLFTQKEPEEMDAAIVFAQPNELLCDENWLWRIKARVAFTMWEQTRLSEDLWKFHKDYDNFTELWVPCGMNHKPFGEITEIPIETIWLGVDTDFYKYQNRDWKNGPLRFCMNGALGYRKGSFLVLEAYRQMCEKHPEWDVELHLKTSQAFCSYFTKVAPNVFLHRELFDLEGLRKYYGGMHVMVAPSRGEGFHQPPLEFMATGGLVITTNWGGPAEWVNSFGCLIVSHKMEDTIGKWGGALPGSQWASPNQDDILAKMEFAYQNRDYIKNMGEHGSEIAKNYNWPIVTKIMKERLLWLKKNRDSRKKKPEFLLEPSRT